LDENFEKILAPELGKGWPRTGGGPLGRKGRMDRNIPFIVGFTTSYSIYVYIPFGYIQHSYVFRIHTNYIKMDDLRVAPF
jgi:hypothetical protein